ncbi:hypothetical protein DB88DRAFT_488166 [Papiliotrema laurentii]|uniref:Uncharacterized protein n=1 Tax=Papiliotrema laurentii TaxID=5418 RepID=A0AAD9L6K9_PAPLA|nr:hypothetical protein DB88DRAFT_488166 [Papiliotrema laurentii]
MMRTSISLRFLLVLFACFAFATALPRELQRRQLTDATSYIEVSSNAATSLIVNPDAASSDYFPQASINAPPQAVSTFTIPDPVPSASNLPDIGNNRISGPSASADPLTASIDVGSKVAASAAASSGAATSRITSPVTGIGMALGGIILVGFLSSLGVVMG